VATNLGYNFRPSRAASLRPLWTSYTDAMSIGVYAAALGVANYTKIVL
jgi:hypothetical protein